VALPGLGAPLLAALVLSAGVAFASAFAFAPVPMPASAGVASAWLFEDLGSEYPGDHGVDDEVAGDLWCEDHGQQCTGDGGYGWTDAQVDGKDGAALG
jgi:hypothetical protein